VPAEIMQKFLGHTSITTTTRTYYTRKSPALLSCARRAADHGLAVRLTITASNIERQLSTDKPYAAG
jgi:hypothetical protein